MATRRQACSWEQARSQALSFARSVAPVSVDPAEAVGSVLAEPLRAQADIPAYDTAMADGWAVSGPGPWRIREASRRDMFAGLDYYDSNTHTRILDGQATPIVAGEAVGPGVTAVVSNQRSHLADGLLKPNDPSARNRIELGSGIRSRGSDAQVGDKLVGATERVTPAVAALAALAGNDTITVYPMPRVAVIRLGEVLDTGVPRSGLRRDAVSPALPGWIAGLGARCEPPRWVTQGDGELIDEIEDVLSDLIVTTGPGAGAAVRRVLPALNANVLVDGIACSPGATSLLAQLPDGRHLVHIGEAPNDALAALLTLLAPMVEAMGGRPDPARRSRTTRMVVGDRTTTGLIPARYVGDRSQDAEVISPGGPGGLFALSAADCVIVVPPGGVATNEPVTVLPMP